MTIYLSNRDGNGKTNEEGHFRLLSKVLKGKVVASSDLQVSQNDPLGLNVRVNSGDYRIETSGGNYAYSGWIDAPTLVEISPADASNPRITLIVLYVDKSAPTSPTPPNNPGVARLMAVNGVASTAPVTPSNSAIQSAVGSNNPYIILASINIGAAATQVTDADITDMREQVKMNTSIIAPDDLVAAIGPLLYPVGSIYTNATNNENPATLLGFGTWVRFAEGRVPTGYHTTDTDFNPAGKIGGTKSHDHKGYGDNDGYGSGDLRATIGSAFGQVDTINFQAIQPINPNTGAGLGNGTYSVRGTSAQGNVRFSHYTKVVGYTAKQTSLQPYIVVYMWRRTA